LIAALREGFRVRQNAELCNNYSAMPTLSVDRASSTGVHNSAHNSLQAHVHEFTTLIRRMPPTWRRQLLKTEWRNCHPMHSECQSRSKTQTDKETNGQTPGIEFGAFSP